MVRVPCHGEDSRTRVRYGKLATAAPRPVQTCSRLIPYHMPLPCMTTAWGGLLSTSCSDVEMVARVISANDTKRPPNSLPVLFSLALTLRTGKEFPGWVIIKSATCMWFVIRLASWCDDQFQYCILWSNYLLITPSGVSRQFFYWVQVIEHNRTGGCI